MRSAIFLLTLAIGCAHPPQVVERVVVRDHNFEVLRTLDDSRTLEGFSRIWSMREETETPDQGEFLYMIDITANHGSGRWRYRADGFTVLLSPHAQTVYLVSDPTAFNSLLGIAQSQD